MNFMLVEIIPQNKINIYLHLILIFFCFYSFFPPTFTSLILLEYFWGAQFNCEDLICFFCAEQPILLTGAF